MFNWNYCFYWKCLRAVRPVLTLWFRANPEKGIDQAMKWEELFCPALFPGLLVSVRFFDSTSFAPCRWRASKMWKNEGVFQRCLYTGRGCGSYRPHLYHRPAGLSWGIKKCDPHPDSLQTLWEKAQRPPVRCNCWLGIVQGDAHRSTMLTQKHNKSHVPCQYYWTQIGQILLLQMWPNTVG